MMSNKPEAFADVPDEWVEEVQELAAAAGRIGCMRWVRDEPGHSVWVSEAALCCSWVHDGLTRIRVNIPMGQELRLRNGQALTPC